MFPLASTHATLVVRHRKNPVDSERQCVPSGSLTSAAEVELHAEIRHAASTTTSAQGNSRFPSDIRRNAARKGRKTRCDEEGPSLLSLLSQVAGRARNRPQKMAQAKRNLVAAVDTACNDRGSASPQLRSALCSSDSVRCDRSASHVCADAHRFAQKVAIAD